MIDLVAEPAGVVPGEVYAEFRPAPGYPSGPRRPVLAATRGRTGGRRAGEVGLTELTSPACPDEVWRPDTTIIQAYATSIVDRNVWWFWWD